MKGNILNRFAINDLKIHKKDTVIMMITIFIASLITLLIAWLSPVYLNYQYINYLKEDGNYSYMGYYDKDNAISDIKPIINGKEYSLADLDTCYLYDCGTAYTYSTIYSLSGNTEIVSLKLKEGKLPTNENEIAIKQSELELWGYTYELNKQIDIAYSKEDKGYSHSYKIVGLLEESGPCNILASSSSYEKYQVYIKLDDNQIIDNSESIGLLQGETIKSFSLSIDKQVFALTYIDVIIVFITTGIIYGLTLTSFDKKTKDYTLLRSIGITERQMYYVIVLQSLILSLLPSFLAMMIIFVVSFLFPSYQNISLPFSISQMITQVVIIIIITFFSYFLPARKSLRQSLSGAFDGQIHQYFYYRYKKLHHLNPIYLAHRLLVGVKKQMIIKIILIVMTTFILSSTFCPVIFAYKYNENDDTNNDLKYINYEISADKNSSQIDLKDFRFFKEYAVYEIPYKSFYSNEMNAYCYELNNDLKDYYDLEDIQNNEVVITNSFIDELPESCHVGDTISFNNDDKKYIIKQIIYDEKLIVFFTSQSYATLCNQNEYTNMLVVFQNIKDIASCFNKYCQEINALNQKYNIYDEYIRVSLEKISVDNTSINTTTLIIAILILMIYVYQYMFELYKQKEEIGSYQLLGLTNKEITSIYFYKTLIVTLIGFIIGMGAFIMDVYYNYSPRDFHTFMITTLVPLLLTIIIILFIINVICVIPLKGILKHDGIENKNIRE
jgi:ABC-type lipoprotein release transport system permease subunit